MQASIGQYSIQAGEPAQPVQQSVVIARMRGFFLRVAFPSPSDIGQCFSTMSKMFGSSNPVMSDTLTQGLFGTQSETTSTQISLVLARVRQSTEFHHEDTRAFAVFEMFVTGAQASSLVGSPDLVFLCV